MKDFANLSLLAEGDVDKLASVLTNLMEEVITLSERVAALEGDADPEGAQERIEKIINRVLGPLA